MAGLAAQFPGQQVSNDLYNALDFAGWDQRNQQFNSAMQNEQENRKAAIQDYLFNEQNNPIKLRQAGLTADTTAAELPGKQAQSTIQSVNARIATATEAQATKAKLSEYAKTISDSDLQQAVDHVKQMQLTAKTPQEKQAAEILWGQLSDVKLEREKLRSQEGIHKGNNAATVEAARIAAASREAVANTAAAARGKVAGGKLDTLLGKMTFEQRAGFYRAMADDETDPERKTLYGQRADEFELANQRAKQAAVEGKSGIDVTATTGGKVVERPGRLPGTSFNNPAAASPNPSPAADPIRKQLISEGKPYEPDKYVYRIGPNGQVQKKAK